MKMQSGAWEGKYIFASCFKNGDGTNPEELIGAEPAECYARALSNELAEAGYATGYNVCATFNAS